MVPHYATSMEPPSLERQLSSPHLVRDPLPMRGATTPKRDDKFRGDRHAARCTLNGGTESLGITIV